MPDRTPACLCEEPRSLFYARFFNTLEEYIGLAPANSRLRDLVCVLLSLDTPAILRRDGKGQFEVIGVCYVHGLMDVEALLGPLPNNCRVEVATTLPSPGEFEVPEFSYANIDKD
jgi:hypothetical protein